MIGVVVRQGSNQRRVKNAEHGDVGTDSQGENGDHYGGEARSFDQSPDRIAGVEQQVFQWADPALIAHSILDELDVAELPPRSLACLCRRHPCPEVLLYLHFEVEFNLAVQSFFYLRLAEQGVERLDRACHPSHRDLRDCPQ